MSVGAIVKPQALSEGAARIAELALPLGGAAIMPLLPIIVKLADVPSKSAPLGSRDLAVVLALAVAALALASFVGLLVRRGVAAFTRVPLALPIGALFVVQALAALAGVSPRTSGFAIGCLVANLIAYVACYWNLADVRVRRSFLGTCFGSAIAATAFAIWLALERQPPEAFAFVHGRASGTFLQPNEYAGYLLFVIPLGLAQYAAPPWLRSLGFAAAALGIVGLALSVARGSWVGFAIGLTPAIAAFGPAALVGYAAAAVLSAVGLALPGLRWLVLGLVALGAIVSARLDRRALTAFVATAIVGIAFAGALARDDAHDPSENTSRIAVWRGAMRMAERFALVGVGPVAFSHVYPQLKQPDAAVDEVHAHDLALNVLVEDGVVGLAVFAWFVVAAIAAARRRARDVPLTDLETRALLGGLLAAFVASAVQNLIDVVTTFLFLLWWPMLALALSKREPGAETAA